MQKTKWLLIIFIGFLFSGLATAVNTQEKQTGTNTKQTLNSQNQNYANWLTQSQAFWTPSSTDIVTNLTGYAFVGYDKVRKSNSKFMVGAFNPIFNMLYKDLILAEAEVEFELDAKGKTEVALEYATLDFFINDYMVLLGGKFLSPLGQFVQNLHPAWINKLASNPVGFNRNQAAPRNDIGFELRGGLPICDTKLNYAAYIANGPEANIVDGLINNIDSGGFNADEDGHKVGGGRIAFLPIPSLEIGISTAFGRLGLFNNPDDTQSIETRRYNAFGLDASYQWGNVNLRGEYIKQQVSHNNASTIPGNKWRAWYTQIAYRILSTQWESVLRYGNYKTLQAEQRKRQTALGINYWFASNVVAKGTYEFNHGQPNTSNNENRILFQMAYGF